MDIKYKGISKEDIMKIQEVHIPKYSEPPTLDKFDWSQFGTAELSGINQMIDRIAEREARNTDTCIICEMAKLYLNTLKDRKCCKTCAYHDDWTWVCFNGDSENRADFTQEDFVCSCWKNKEGDLCKE